MKKRAILLGIFSFLFLSFTQAENFSYTPNAGAGKTPITSASFYGHAINCGLSGCQLTTYIKPTSSTCSTRHLFSTPGGKISAPGYAPGSTYFVASGTFVGLTGTINEILSNTETYVFLVGSGTSLTAGSPCTHQRVTTDVYTSYMISEYFHVSHYYIASTSDWIVPGLSNNFMFGTMNYSGQVGGGGTTYTYTSDDGTGAITSDIVIEVELGTSILTGYPNYYIAGAPAYTGSTGAMIYAVNQAGTGYFTTFIDDDTYLDSALNGYYKYEGADTFNFYSNYAIATGVGIAYLEFTGTSIGTGNMSSQLAENLVKLSRSNAPMLMTVIGGFILLMLLFGIFGVRRKKHTR